MSLTAADIKQFSVTIQEFTSAIKLLALARPVIPKALYATNGTPGEIPARTKAFCIINLGASGLGVTFSDIDISGIDGITEILASIQEFSFTVEVDHNYFKTESPIIVTPAVGHIALVQYITDGNI